MDKSEQQYIWLNEVFDIFEKTPQSVDLINLFKNRGSRRDISLFIDINKAKLIKHPQTYFDLISCENMIYFGGWGKAEYHQ